jgi:hypothetical protein
MIEVAMADRVMNLGEHGAMALLVIMSSAEQTNKT